MDVKSLTPPSRTRIFHRWRISCKDMIILEDPGADSGGEGKSKQAEKYDMKKSKERAKEPLRTLSY